MNVSEFMKMSRECDWAADAKILTFDPETEQYQPVTGATYDDKEIKLYTDCDECGEKPCPDHTPAVEPERPRDLAIGELVKAAEAKLRFDDMTDTDFDREYPAGDFYGVQAMLEEQLRTALAAYKKVSQ